MSTQHHECQHADAGACEDYRDPKRVTRMAGNKSLAGLAILLDSKGQLIDPFPVMTIRGGHS